MSYDQNEFTEDERGRLVRKAPRRELPMVANRSCGPCSLCCTVMQITDMPGGPKERNERCQHLSGGRCGIYTTKPPSCSAFKCLWLQGVLPNELRPDKVRAVGDTNGRGDMVVFHVHPSDKGAWTRGALGRWITAKAASGVDIIVVCGDLRWAFGPVAAIVGRYGVNESATMIEAVRLIGKDAAERGAKAVYTNHKQS